MEIETVDMSQVAAEEQAAAAQARADRERAQQAAETSSNAQTITDPNLGQTVDLLD